MFACFLSNISAEYYKNPLMLSRVIAKNVGDVFLRHSVDCNWIVSNGEIPLGSVQGLYAKRLGSVLFVTCYFYLCIVRSEYTHKIYKAISRSRHTEREREAFRTKTNSTKALLLYKYKDANYKSLCISFS